MLIVGSTDVATTVPTGVVQNRVTITNIGQVAYLSLPVDAEFAGSLDDAVYNADGTASSGDLAFNEDGHQVTWTGDLPVGGSATVTGSFTVDDPPGGDHVLESLATTSAQGSNCPVITPAAQCSTSVPVLTPGLTIAKAADTALAAPGSTVSYTITVTNSGQSDYTGATVHDQMGGVLGDATYDANAQTSRGALSFADRTLTWTGDLAVGQSAVITYSVLVDDPTSATAPWRTGSCPTSSAAPVPPAEPTQPARASWPSSSLRSTSRSPQTEPRPSRPVSSSTR